MNISVHSFPSSGGYSSFEFCSLQWKLDRCQSYTKIFKIVSFFSIQTTFSPELPAGFFHHCLNQQLLIKDYSMFEILGFDPRNEKPTG